MYGYYAQGVSISTAQTGSEAEQRPSSDSEVPPAVGPADC